MPAASVRRAALNANASITVVIAARVSAASIREQGTWHRSAALLRTAAAGRRTRILRPTSGEGAPMVLRDVLQGVARQPLQPLGRVRGPGHQPRPVIAGWQGGTEAGAAWVGRRRSPGGRIGAIVLHALLQSAPLGRLEGTGEELRHFMLAHGQRDGRARRRYGRHLGPHGLWSRHAQLRPQRRDQHGHRLAPSPAREDSPQSIQRYAGHCASQPLPNELGWVGGCGR
eukprot:scaffold1017_cov374-Prasinococcus_capsulatus_cf.AAC.18